MRLVHRTNYWGKDSIQAFCAYDEDDVEEPCVWVQARPDGIRPCCHRRGTRNVDFDAWSLTHEGGGNSGCEWVLYLIRQNYGDSEDHYFFKFCLCPRGYEPANRKVGRWEVVSGDDGKGAFWIDEQSNGLSALEERIFNRTGMGDDGWDEYGEYFVHCHVGIICDSLAQA